MIRAAGIDLGGSKSEVQLFDNTWALHDKRRDPTPDSYSALLELLANQVAWARAQGGTHLPVGIGSAGLIDHQGLAFTANLPAMGHPLPSDLAAKAAQPLTWINDCRALALSEAALGAGRGYEKTVALILGTGLGGGLIINGALMPGPTGTGGEFGHMPASAAAIAEAGLDLRPCGCGQWGCYESYLSGPNLSQIAADRLKKPVTVEELAKAWGRDPKVDRIWNGWLRIAADLLKSIIYVADPDIIIIAGGLSKIPQLAEALSGAVEKVQLPGFAIPPISIAQGGDASGARGAALAADQAFRKGQGDA